MNGINPAQEVLSPVLCAVDTLGGMETLVVLVDTDDPNGVTSGFPA